MSAAANVERVAERFVALLREQMTPAQFAEVVRRNASESDPHVCHSHDFTDANMAMADAIDAVVGVGFDDNGELWHAAWAVAKQTALGANANDARVLALLTAADGAILNWQIGDANDDPTWDVVAAFGDATNRGVIHFDGDTELFYAPGFDIGEARYAQGLSREANTQPIPGDAGDVEQVPAFESEPNLPEGHLDDGAICRAIASPTEACYLSGVAIARILDALRIRMNRNAAAMSDDDAGTLERDCARQLTDTADQLSECIGIYNDLIW
jgi:hypothetical protein